MKNQILSVENLSNVGLKNIESVKKLETLGLRNNEITYKVLSEGYNIAKIGQTFKL